jgi:hypothetical protein
VATYSGQDNIFDYISKGLQDGLHTIRLGTVDFPVQVVNYPNNVTISSNTILGSGYNTRGTIIIYHKNLTINSGATLTDNWVTPGLYIWVSGTLTNNGIISMTAKGNHGFSYSNFHLYKNGTVFATLPTVGGSLGSGTTISAGTNVNNATVGANGSNAPTRGTGGGGAGSAFVRGINGTRSATSGSGSSGSQFGGGAGGGSIDQSSNSNHSANSASGISGGNAFARRSDTSFVERGAGGGAGGSSSSGGDGRRTYSGETTGTLHTPFNGVVGVGGVLVIYANTLTNNGQFQSRGSNGGTGLGGGGGASGGGSVNVFYRTGVTGTVSVTGGTGGSVSRDGAFKGGNGGNGSYVATVVPSDRFLKTSITPSIVNLGAEFAVNCTITSSFNSTNYSAYLLQGEVKTFILENQTTNERNSNLNISITRDLITNTSDYAFVIEAESNGIVATSSITVSIVDTVPKIESYVVNDNNTTFIVNSTITDDEMDFVKYRVLLNGVKIHPTETDFTSFMQSPVNYTENISSSNVEMENDNLLTIDVYDTFNNNVVNNLSFFAGYRGLLFSNSEGIYYTTDIGQLLNYFDFGYINYGEYSKKSFFLKNTLGITKNNVTLITNNTLDPLVTVEFSLDDISYSSQLNVGSLNNLQEVEVFVRIRPNSKDINDREFEIIVGSD